MGDYRFPVMEFFPYQYNVKSRSLTTPPTSPTDGDRYIVGVGATGAWQGHDNEIAWILNGVWYFDVPAEGWITYVEDEHRRVLFTGTSWEYPYILLSEKGQPNGVATLDGNGKVTWDQLPDGVRSGLHPAGFWDASSGTYPTNTPNAGEYWIVTNGGYLDGVEYKKDDWLVYVNDTIGWDKIDNTDKVTSVNGKAGTVQLTTDDVPEGTTNLYYTDARVSANPDVAANTQARLKYVPSLRMAVATL